MNLAKPSPHLAFIPDSRLRERFMPRALRLLKAFGCIFPTAHTRFLYHRNVVKYDGAKIVFIATAEVYEGSQLRLSLGATCGAHVEPFLVVDSTAQGGSYRIVRRISVYELHEGSPVKRWGRTEHGECTWYGHVHKRSLIEETEVESIARFEAAHATWLEVEAATESLIRELGPSWFENRDPRPATVIEWPWSNETEASGLGRSSA